MSESGHKVKTKKKKFKVKDKEKKKEFEIEVIDEEASFDKNEKNQTAKVKAKVTTRDIKDGKAVDENKKEKPDADLEVSYDKGTLWDNLELKKVDGNEIDGSKKFGGSYKWPFWLMMSIIALLAIGGIVWWIMASRKEDKEEGEL